MSVRSSDQFRNGGNGNRWLSAEPFDPWGEEEEKEDHNGCATKKNNKGAKEEGCKVIVRARHAGTPWERMVSFVVGNPVHLDVVLARDGCSAGKFCFSSYMGHRFEVAIMNERMIRDDSMSNVYMHVSEEEYERCMGFMMALVEKKARYDYFDAMVLMPMFPKTGFFSSEVAKTLVDDVDSRSPEGIKKVFCSQSVILMLRHSLDPNGRHGSMLKQINEMNSKLVSPKQVMGILSCGGAQEMSNDELAGLCQ
jgi:hypothetical protein